MWYISGYICGAGTISWHGGGQQRNEEEGMTITFSLGASPKLTSLLDKRQQRQRLERLGRFLDKNEVSWIVPGDEEWSLNLDVLKDAFREHIPELSSMDWFKGQISIEPEFKIDEREVFDEPRYEAAAVFKIVPEVMNAKDSELPRLKFLPVEIQKSLARFKQEYPDPSKVAFIMMQFGKTPAHAEIAEAIKSALKPHGIAGLRADDKQYHDDLFPNVMTYIYGCGFGIAVFERLEAEEFNPNVALEVGYMFGLRKPVCLLKDRTLKTLHADLVGKLYKVFDPQNPTGTIPKVVSEWLYDKELISAREPSLPLSKQLRRLKEQLEKQLERLPAVRKLYLNHPDSETWRKTIRLFLRRVDEAIPDSDFVKQYDDIAWHPPSDKTVDAGEQRAIYMRACNATEGIMRAALEELQGRSV